MKPKLLLACCLAALSLHAADSGFQFKDINEKSIGLWEGDRPVFVYNQGVISKPGVPADRARSSYIHPLYGLDGEVLTDDFPKDHYHHRGLFWAWPHVRIGDQEYDLWMLKGIRHQFEHWLARKASDTAVLGVQNGWYIDAKKVVDEQVWLRIYPATAVGQAIDVELIWTPIEKPITLRGAEGKSYGGLTLRFTPHKGEPIITTPDGVSPKDLPITRLPWADLTAQFTNAPGKSGAALFIDPSHPDYPPEWLTRHYGVLCVGWPGVKEQTFQAGEPIHCRYRVWIHRGELAPDAIQQIYRNYTRDASFIPPISVQAVEAKLESNRIIVTIEGKPFTEYIFSGEKYPYFYPVIGPHSGKSVTEKRLPNFPHHSSIFFGSDKVNGGDYWQEGLDRGRIVSKGIQILDASLPNEITFVQTCDWERPGAESPFTDSRVIKVSAPSPTLRYIDFTIKLTAKTKVRIEKTNHSLFSVRMAPDLCVRNGGILMNASGDMNEKGTFGNKSAWADFHGTRDGEVEGATILCHPSNKWFPSEWFTRDYGFMSPTPFFWPKNGATEFQPGETATLRYRVLVYSGKMSRAQIQREFDLWSKR